MPIKNIATQASLGGVGQSVLDAIKKKKGTVQKVASTVKRGVEIGSGIKPMTPDEAAKIREELTKPRQSIADKIVKGMVNNGMLSQETVDNLNQQINQNRFFKKSDPLYKRIEDKLKAKGVLK